MILQEVAKNVSKEGVQLALQRIYFPDMKYKKGIYSELLSQIQSLPIRPTEESMTIHVEYANDCGSDESIWTSTYSLNKRFNRKFLLEFASIEQISSANVLEEELTNKEEYMAHILRELLYNHESEEEETRVEEDEKERREHEEPEYCSVQEILGSMEATKCDD